MPRSERAGSDRRRGGSAARRADGSDALAAPPRFRPRVGYGPLPDRKQDYRRSRSMPEREEGARLGGLWRDRRHWRCRSEEHTSELQSLRHLVCRLLLEKKKKTN